MLTSPIRTTLFCRKSKKILSLLFFSAVLHFANASPNLILNPSAESVTGGVLDNWTDIADLGDCCGGGIWWMPNGNRYGTPPAVDGVNIFSAGTRTGSITCELRQDVDVTGYAAAIDAGTAVFTFSGYMAGDGSGDLQQIVIEYRDASNTTVLGSQSTGFINEPFAFVSTGSLMMLAPIGTRFIRIRLMAQNHSGSMDGYFDDLSLTTTAPLPVTLLDFYATLKPDKTVILQWQTVLEDNSKDFEVQRSSTGNNYATIGSVNSAGNSSILLSYSYTDPSPGAGNNFYRLKMVDLDGKYKYSPIVALNLNGSNDGITLLGNPFTDVIRLKINQQNQDRIDITLTDISGRVYMRETLNTHAGESFVDLKMQMILAPGPYLLSIKSMTTRTTVKVLKE